MKYKFAFILVLLALSSFALAEEVIQEDSSIEETSPSDSSLKDNLKDLADKPKELLSNEITLPESLKDLSRTIFKIDSTQDLTLTRFILLSLIFIFFLILFEALISSVVSNKLISLAASLVLTYVFSIIGGINFMAGELSTKKIVLIVIGLFIFLFIFKKIFKRFSQSAKVSKAREEGRAVGTEISKLKAISEVDEVA